MKLTTNNYSMAHENKSILKTAKADQSLSSRKSDKRCNSTAIDGKNNDRTRVRTIPSRPTTLTSSLSAFRLDSLNLKPKLFIECQELLGIQVDEVRYREMQEGIWDLYNSIRNHFKPYNFLKTDKLSQALIYVVNSFMEIKHPNSEFVIARNTSSNDSYNWYFREWRIVDCPDHGVRIPICILEDLLNKDITLHDTLVAIFTYIVQQTNVYFEGQNDDGYGMNDYCWQALEERILEARPEDKEEMEDTTYWLNMHKSGAAHQYHELIWKNKKKITKEKILTMIDWCYETKTVKSSIVQLEDWVKRLINFFETEGAYSVYQFDYNFNDPDSQDGPPIFYSQYVGFFWSQTDALFKEIDMHAEMTANEMGIAPPSWSRHWYAHQTVGEIKDSDWPLTLFNFFNEYKEKVEPELIKNYELDKKRYRH